MLAHFCPHCGDPLSKVEVAENRCFHCRGTFPPGAAQTQAPSESRPPDRAQLPQQDMPIDKAACLPLPRSVKVLAVIYLLVGGLALIDTIWGLLQGRTCSSLYLLAIPLGLGLLRQSPAWRKLALWAAVLHVLGLAVGGYLLYRFHEEADVWSLLAASWGPSVARLALAASAVFTAAVLAVCLWSLFVLRRKDVRASFQRGRRSRGSSGWRSALGVVLLLGMFARATGGLPFDFFKSSQRDVWRTQPFSYTTRDLPLQSFQAPCLIEVLGMGEERYCVVTTFTVIHRGRSSRQEWHWESFGGLAVAQVPSSLRDAEDRIVIEVDRPEIRGNYWMPLWKNFTAHYQARIHGKGRYKEYEDRLTLTQQITLSGPCSLPYLKQWLLARTEQEAVGTVIRSALAAANLPVRLVQRGKEAVKARRYDSAIEDLNRAIALNPEVEDGHYYLGRALLSLGRAAEAQATFRRSLKLEPEKEVRRKCHYYLGWALLRQGRYTEAGDAFAHSHILDAQAMERSCKRFPLLEPQLATLLEEKVDAGEARASIDGAYLCYCRGRYTDAARLYEKAFAADPTLADNRESKDRFKAACSAALAGCIPLKDGAEGEKKRRHWRQQALDWLRAELALSTRRLKDLGRKEEQGEKVDEEITELEKELRSWTSNDDFAGVRDDEGLERMSEAERGKWKQLWADVGALLPEPLPRDFLEDDP